MKLFELTTGVIAAVILALGAGHYTNNTKVEEEPVVEIETVTKVWFEYTGPAYGQPGYDPHDPNKYTLFEDDILEEPDCTNGPQVCAVRTRQALSSENLPIPNSDDLEDMEDDINNGQGGEDLQFKPIPSN